MNLINHTIYQIKTKPKFDLGEFVPNGTKNARYYHVQAVDYPLADT